jgi:hypothetical protein
VSSLEVPGGDEPGRAVVVDERPRAGASGAIASSPALGTISDLDLRALRIEDLFLLKLASGRTRDLDDLDLLALVKWHGDRHAILGFADALVVQLRRLFGCDPVASIARLEITAGQRALLLDTYDGRGSG